MTSSQLRITLKKMVGLGVAWLMPRLRKGNGKVIGMEKGKFIYIMDII